MNKSGKPAYMDYFAYAMILRYFRMNCEREATAVLQLKKISRLDTHLKGYLSKNCIRSRVRENELGPWYSSMGSGRKFETPGSLLPPLLVFTIALDLHWNTLDWSTSYALPESEPTMEVICC
jgi:hypothetical protein